MHLFCENKRAGEFNGQRLRHDVANGAKKHILRIWSVDSSPAVERQTCDRFGGLRRVLHVAIGAPVMLTTNLCTVWNLVNGLRGTVVAVLSDAAFASAGSAGQRRPATEVGGVSVNAVKYVVVDFPAYMGPVMVAGHPKWVCIPRQTVRHEKYPNLNRKQFPVVLSYGMTVHKSQGLTLKEGCVFNMTHDPKWCPFKSMCGLAFVGMSRTTDFALMAFKYVPDYWVFRSAADTDMFRWRAVLEIRLDALHDALAAAIHEGRNSVADDLARHAVWSEGRRGGVALSAEELQDLKGMLSVRGVLPWPEYEKPSRMPASKAGGGRSQRKTMRAVAADKQKESEVDVIPEDEQLDADFLEEMRELENFDAYYQEMLYTQQMEDEQELFRYIRENEPMDMEY